MDALSRFKVEGRYSYHVEWSIEDQAFVGRCDAFPSLSWLDPDENQAYSGIEKLVFEVVQDMADNDEIVP